MKLTNFHIVISSLAAIAGVAIAGYQALGPKAPPQPVNVVVALDQQKADAGLPDSIIEKTDPVPALATESINLAQDASFAAALKDDTADRYSFSSLFDGQDDTFLAITQDDQELNILVTFKDGTAHSVTALEYTPPAGVDPTLMAASVDVMILPEGQLEASGRPVISFSLPQSSESRTFAIPGRAEGKGLWIRVAGNPAADKSFVGDFRILSEIVAP
ncbi:hypothetical protein [Aestuariivirga sp.]|uniref:hypothetical protein n=1 Tax=Aestuariivirga sp. TaxID=2650926 RepID=UPI0035946E62